MDTYTGASTQSSAKRKNGTAGGAGTSVLPRLGAWMGVAFSVLFVAGFITIPSPENGDGHPQEWDNWWSDSGHRVLAVIGTYLMLLALGAFVWFLWSLHRRLRESGPMVIFGSLFAAVAMVSTI